MARPTPSALARQLATHEAIIERGLHTFVEVGKALAAIRSERLYRESHKTFDDYCRERWGMDRTYAHRHIQGAEVAALLPIGNTPLNEAHTRVLGRSLDDPELIRDVWERVSKVGADRVTAKALQREVVATRTRRNAERLESEPVEGFTGNASGTLPLEAFWPSDVDLLRRKAKRIERRAEELRERILLGHFASYGIDPEQRKRLVHGGLTELEWAVPGAKDAIWELEAAIAAAEGAMRVLAGALRDGAGYASDAPKPWGAQTPERARELLESARRQKIKAGYCSELGCWNRLAPGETSCRPGDCWGWTPEHGDVDSAGRAA